MKSQGKMIRRMGYIRDQQGIMNRYIRETSNWKEHLQRTREFIRTSFSDHRIESVAVLGSGWLLDVPLDDLRERFNRVYLVDIHHPVQIRKKTSSMANVKLVETDLSGGAVKRLWQLCRDKSTPEPDQLIEQISLTHPYAYLDAHAVISVNLLNQLDILLYDFLRKHGDFQQEQASRFRSVIQKFHLQCITETPGCLVTDVMEITMENNGNRTYKTLLYTDLPEGFRRDRWTWEFDTHGTYKPKTLTTMEVTAVEWA